jgi:hypothetical protein
VPPSLADALTRWGTLPKTCPQREVDPCQGHKVTKTRERSRLICTCTEDKIRMWSCLWDQVQRLPEPLAFWKTKK